MSEKTGMWCVECQRQPDSMCAAYKHTVEQKWPNGDPLNPHDPPVQTVEQLKAAAKVNSHDIDAYLMDEAHLTKLILAARAEGRAEAQVTLDIVRADRDRQWQRAEAAEAEVTRLSSLLADLHAENMCDACGGNGSPVSGKPCMCAGTGRMSDAARTLRKELFEASSLLAQRSRESDDYAARLADLRAEFDARLDAAPQEPTA